MTVETGAPSGRTDALLSQCVDLLSRFEYAAAEKFCRRALAEAPQSTQALLLLASILTDTGRLAEAETVLQQSIAAAPDAGHEAYVALAQMRSGRDALALYARGLTAASRGSRAPILCAMAEIYMTDLCMEEDAEAQSEALVLQAVAAAEEDAADGDEFSAVACGLPEALVALANVRLCQTRPDDAAAVLRRSLALWAAMPYDNDAYPPYEHRLATARLLVEVGEWDAALGVCDALCMEDDECVEPWYLAALCHYSRASGAAGAPGDAESASASSEALAKAEAALARSEDAEAHGALADAVRELRAALSSLAPDEMDEDSADE